MSGTFFYVGLGAGFAAACGLRPFLPLLLAGALASSHALGVSFASPSFHFLESGWWLLAVAIALALSYALQFLLRLPPTLDAPPGPGSRSSSGNAFAAALAGLGLGAGAVLFAGTLADHHDAAWPGIVAGLLIAALAQRAFWPVISRARARLPDRGAREALTVYLDSAALLVAALAALLHLLGYLAVAALAAFAWRGRGRGREKYAGLRILRR